MMQLNGILLVDKPQEITSHDVVDRLRKVSGMRRIGHTGTLDPRATGLLVLCFGQATRLSQYITSLEKAYVGAMRLGITTTSHDMDGEVIQESPLDSSLNRDVIQQACNEFVGKIMQTPPMVSAVKIGGKRLYKLARQGKDIDRPARPVTIHEFSILAWNSPEAELRIVCSSGAYVRTLCHDVGQKLGCGAALERLRRVRIGGYRIEDAAALDSLDTRDKIAARLMSMDNALDLPSVVVNKAREQLIRDGNAISAQAVEGTISPGVRIIQIKTTEGKLLALASVHPTAAGARIQPRRVFTH